MEINSSLKEKVRQGEETKYRHELVLSKGKRNRKLKMIERENQKIFKRTYADKWKMFKKAGFPVVPTLRETEDGRLFLTDVTGDGSELYGKALVLDLEDLSANPSGFKSQEVLAKMKNIESFLKILTGREFYKIKSKVEKYRKLANEKHLCLPADDPFELILHPDGTWNLIMLDLNAVLSQQSDDFIKLSNDLATTRFIADLINIEQLYRAIFTRGTKY